MPGSSYEVVFNNYKKLQEYGIQPDMILCRTQIDIPENEKNNCCPDTPLRLLVLLYLSRPEKGVWFPQGGRPREDLENVPSYDP